MYNDTTATHDVSHSKGKGLDDTRLNKTHHFQRKGSWYQTADFIYWSSGSISWSSPSHISTYIHSLQSLNSATKAKEKTFTYELSSHKPAQPSPFLSFLLERENLELLHISARAVPEPYLSEEPSTHHTKASTHSTNSHTLRWLHFSATAQAGPKSKITQVLSCGNNCVQGIRLQDITASYNWHFAGTVLQKSLPLNSKL